MSKRSWSTFGLVGLVATCGACTATTSDEADETALTPSVGDSEGAMISQLGGVTLQGCDAIAQFAVRGSAEEITSINLQAQELEQALKEVSLLAVDEVGKTSLVQSASLSKSATAQASKEASHSSVAALQDTTISQHNRNIEEGTSASSYETTSVISESESVNAMQSSRTAKSHSAAVAAEQSAASERAAQASTAEHSDATRAEQAAVSGHAVEQESAAQSASATRFGTGYGGFSSGMGIGVLPGMASQYVFGNAAEKEAEAVEQAAAMSAAASQSSASASAQERVAAQHEAAAIHGAESEQSVVADSVVTSSHNARQRATHAAAAQQNAYANASETAALQHNSASFADERSMAHSAASETLQESSNQMVQEQAAHQKSSASFQQLEKLDSRELIVQVVIDAAALSKVQKAVEASQSGASSFVSPIALSAGFATGVVSRSFAPSIPLACQ